MENPFYYGEEVSDPYFIGRKREIADLVGDLARGQNVIVYSPRRYGKTSLIKKVLSTLNSRGLLTFYVNLYAATTKKKFIDIYARAIATGTKGRIDKIIDVLKDLFPRMLPRVIIKGDDLPEFEFEYGSKTDATMPLLEDLYGAVEKYARKKKQRAVVVFDEFQEILDFEDDEVERSMRGFIQSHKNTAYAFLGSRRHLMQKIFNDVNRPFYKSGRMFPLSKIRFEEFSPFITDKFKKGKIRIQQAEVDRILEITACHPYYTQMLCSVLWDRNSEPREIIEDSLDKAVSELIARESYTYVTLWDGLPTSRKLLLEALAKEGEEKIYSQEFISRHELGNPSQVQKNIKFLLAGGLVYKGEDRLEFSDIFFKQWILRQIV